MTRVTSPVTQLRRRTLTSGLFGAYGPVLAEDEPTARALLEAARRVALRCRARYLVIKGAGEEPAGAPCGRLDQWAIATLPLQADPEMMWAGLRGKVRNSVRKAPWYLHTLRGRSPTFDPQTKAVQGQGVPPEAALAGALLYHSVHLIPTSLVGPWALRRLVSGS